MKFKIYDKANKIMYMDAEKINDPKWNFGRLHNNIHCVTCVSLDKLSKENELIYEYDLLKIQDTIFYVSPIKEGKTYLIGLNCNIVEELSNFNSDSIEVIGSYLEINNKGVY